MRLTAIFIMALLWVGTAAADIADGPVARLLWNRVDQVLVVDTVALCLSDAAISVNRWDDSLRQFVLGEVVDLPFGAVSARRFDSLLVIRTDDDRLAAYNLFRLPQLEGVWAVDPGGAFADFAVVRGRVYVSRWFDGLWRYDPLSGGEGTLLDTSMTGVMITQLEADDSHLYVLDEYNGIMRYNPSLGGSAAFVDYLNVPVEVSAFHAAAGEITMQARSGGIVLGEMGGETPLLGPTVAPGVRPRKIFVAGERIVAVMARSIEVRDRATGTLESALQVGGLGVAGDLLTPDSGQYLALPMMGGGIYLFDIEHPSHSGPGSHRSGPVQALAFVGDHLMTGGGGNPIDVFSFDSSLTPTLEYTMYPELAGVQAIVPVGDTLVAYYATINRVAFILDALQPDSFFLERSFHLDDTLAGRLQYLPRLRSDTLRGVVAAGEFALQAYAIDDSGTITTLAPWAQSARIVSTLVQDTFVFVGTMKKQLWVQKIDSALGIAPVTSIDLADLPTALAWINGRLGVFGENALNLYALDSLGSLNLQAQVELPLTVLDVAFANGRMYAIGSTGIGAFALDSLEPELIDFGGGPGRLIAAAGEALAASDGGAIEIYRIEAADDSGGGPPLPEKFALYQNYPNPFNSGTVIRFDLPRASRVKLTIYNTLGQRVKTLVDGERDAGAYEILWDGTNSAGKPVASGVYLYRVEAGNISDSKKMVLVK